MYLGVLHWSEYSFWDAQETARVAGGHLATMTTKAEADFVFDLVRYDERFWLVHDFGADGPTFGLYQKEGSREPFGGWTWVTGEPLEYTPWHRGQPNNNEGLDHFGRYSTFPRNYRPGAPIVLENAWVDGKETQWRAFLVEIE